LHFALKELGIPNRLAYARVRHGDWVGDHAFVVADIDGKETVVDAFFPGFHLQELTRLLGRGIQKDKRRYQVKEIYGFPRFWIPNDRAQATQRRETYGRCEVIVLDFLK
jgi:hypothetical protein